MGDRGDVRERLVDAAIAVLVTDRPVSMPLREVAHHAGVTTGAIQHHFGNKEALVLAALQRHGQQFADRLRARRGSGTPGPVGVARAILCELLPLDEPRRVEAQVALAFEKLAVNDAVLATAYREQYTILHDLLAAHLPAGPAAEILLAAVGGIRTDLLLGRITADQAVELLDRLLDVLTG